MLPDEFPDAYRYFIYETFKRIVGNNPQQDFIFITDKKNGQPFIESKNAKTITVAATARYSLLWQYWYDVKITAALKKHKADLFISCDGICSTTAKIPQCLLLHDLNSLYPTGFIKKNHAAFYKKNTAKFLRKAATIATLSEFSKKKIVTEYDIPVDKITAVYSGVDEIFKPMNIDEKQRVKNNYTNSTEYFLYTGEIHQRRNIVNLLKAFSVFKKRQQTNMKLMLVGIDSTSHIKFKEDLKSYKYRNDVVLLNGIEEIERARIIAAAYGLIYPSAQDGFAIPVLEAIQCEVPVIIPENSSMREILEEGALYIDEGNHTAIAEKMMLLYKDENKRKDLFEKSKGVSSRFNWDTTAELFWKTILKIAPKSID